MNKIRKIGLAIALVALPHFGSAQVIFEDNFEGNELDMSNWSYEEGDGCPNLCGWGNNERQIYDRNYVAVEDGNLVITAVKDGDKYFSGKINSQGKQEFQYGVMEMRAKLPSGHGLWPAFWMLGTDIGQVGWPASGEIDIMEYVGREPQTLYTSLHTPASHGETENSKKTYVADIEEGYHTYKAIWSEDDIKFHIDDELVYTFVPEEYDAEHYPFRKPFYFLLNLAVGGNFGGPEVDDSVFPAKYFIDYVRVTELQE